MFFALGCAFYFGSVWGVEFFGEINADQMLITLNSPTEGTDPGVYVSGFEGPVLTTAILTALFSVFAFLVYVLRFARKDRIITLLPVVASRIISLVLAVAVLVSGFIYFVDTFQIVQLYHGYVTASTFIEDNYADPETVNMEFPENKRNLIHIYLESVENTYFSKELGGAMEVNLMPHLYELTLEGYSFSHREEGIGGPHWSTGSGWSVAGFVNMETGLPMKVPVDGNSYGSPGNFMPGATALGDILGAQGYEQSFLLGSDADFGGLTYYFQSHGDFTIIDYKEAKARGYIPEDYSVFWGFEDDKLYEYAKEEITRLYETGKPFHLVMETADTHTPGYLSEFAPTPYGDLYSNAISYSQEEAVKFVRWIQEQPFYENTTIVITGDHTSMAGFYFENLDIPNGRTCFNLILNPAPELGEVSQDRLQGRIWAMFDMFPTILASLGVKIEGEKLGIGTNLFSQTDTIFEQYGVDFVNDELTNRSNFYNFNILINND